MRQKKKYGFGFMSLVAHQFGRVEFRIFDVVSFRQESALEEIKTDIQYSKF